MTGSKPNGHSLRDDDTFPSLIVIMNRFKLQLHPKNVSTAHVSEAIPVLPRGKSAIMVFADFLRYMDTCARQYIEETHLNGDKLWRDLKAHAEVILTHPNGWEGGQQALMCKAAIMAGLIPDTADGRSRLSFVTEGEASLHFCIESSLVSKGHKVD